MGTLEKYTKVKVLRITEIQDNTLKKLSSYNINVAQFMRDAVKEKLQRDYPDIVKTKKKVEYCPFSNGTIIKS